MECPISLLISQVFGRCPVYGHKHSITVSPNGFTKADSVIMLPQECSTLVHYNTK